MTKEIIADMHVTKAATFIHLLLGPNKFFFQQMSEVMPEPKPSHQFWTIFDLIEETAIEHAEDKNYQDINHHWEAFDTNICAFVSFFSKIMPMLKREYWIKLVGREAETLLQTSLEVSQPNPSIYFRK